MSDKKINSLAIIGMIGLSFNSLAIIGMIGLFLYGLSLTSAFLNQIKIEETVKQECIEQGHCQYNPTTGEFEWWVNNPKNKEEQDE